MVDETTSDLIGYIQRQQEALVAHLMGRKQWLEGVLDETRTPDPVLQQNLETVKARLASPDVTTWLEKRLRLLQKQEQVLQVRYPGWENNFDGLPEKVRAKFTELGAEQLLLEDALELIKDQGGIEHVL